jgi:hypothetical protein
MLRLVGSQLDRSNNRELSASTLKGSYEGKGELTLCLASDHKIAAAFSIP